MKNMTKMFPSLVKEMYKRLGGNCVIHHEPTEENPLGQSSVAMFIGDILNIVEAAPDSNTAFKDLFIYFQEGKL